jgi:hypothetical protein
MRDSQILLIVKNAIYQFKKLFPKEEPYIKVQCLRFKRKNEYNGSEKSSWRSIKQIHDGELVSIIEGKDSYEIQTESVKSLTKERKVNIEMSHGRARIRDLSKIEKISHGITNNKIIEFVGEIKDFELGPTELSKMLIVKETKCEDVKVTEMEDFRMSTEIIMNELKEETHFIHLKTDAAKMSVSDQTVLTIKPLENKVLISDSCIEFNDSDIVKILNELKTESKPSDEFNKIFNSRYSTKELIQRYIDVQKKLNKLRGRIDMYTKPDDLKWNESVKSKGFILAIEDLVHFWWDLNEKDDERFD